MFNFAPVLDPNVSKDIFVPLMYPFGCGMMIGQSICALSGIAVMSFIVTPETVKPAMDVATVLTLQVTAMRDAPSF
jgi:hypothetical protein